MERSCSLQNTKLQAILSLYQSPPGTNTNLNKEQGEQYMPPPPTHHIVVDPEATTPSMSSPYDYGEEERTESNDEMPGITINAATQIRGNGNIVSITQMDSIRIANIVATILSGDPAVNNNTAAASTSSSPTPAPVTGLSSSRTERRKKTGLNVNVTVNCGAIIIGDRNIVGPGLGDIARQMQLAQRNAALQARQQQQQQQQQQTQVLQQQKLAQGLAQAQAQKQAQMNLQHSLDRRDSIPGLAQCHQSLYQSQAGLLGVGQVTPPMSRSGSEGSEGSPREKRKAEDDAGEGLLLLKRRV